MDIVNCKDCYNENCKDRGVNLRSMCWAYKGHPQPQTNADRIRNMDDYDLAIFLENVSCRYADTESWLGWLKQEAKK